jgi:hypothetical protein
MKKEEIKPKTKFLNMKKTAFLLAFLSINFLSAQQAFKGKGDTKFNIGMQFQNQGTGIQFSSDFGLGENLSYGFVGAYVLGAKTFNNGVEESSPEFKDRFEAKFRINANLSSVLNIDEKFDLYPGLSLGLKNFGGHVGARYFFTDGFGVFTEAGFPIAKYNESNRYFYPLNNQFTFTIGASFNL